MAMMLILEFYHGYQFSRCVGANGCKPGELISIHRWSLISLGISLTVIGSAFFVFGILTLCALRATFIKFYNDNYIYIFIANLMLVVPLTIKGISKIENGIDYENLPKFKDNK